MKSSGKIASKAFSGLFLALGLISQLFPLLWMVNFSLLKDSQVLSARFLQLPNPPQWVNYAYAWNQGHIGRNFLNSVLVCGAAVAIVSLLSLTLGYAFTRMRWKLRGAFFAVILSAMMIPIYSTLLPNFKIYTAMGLTNTYWALILPYAAFNLPMGIFIMTGFWETLPKALEESAVLDGCGIYGIIFRIIAPISQSAVSTVAIMTFLPCWNEFIMAITYITDGSLKTLPFSVWEFAGQFVSQYAKQFAVFTLSSIPMLLIYVVFNRKITEGVIAGAVKG